jgi:hypothetical protein
MPKKINKKEKNLNGIKGWLLVILIFLAIYSLVYGFLTFQMFFKGFSDVLLFFGILLLTVLHLICLILLCFKKEQFKKFFITTLTVSIATSIVLANFSSLEIIQLGINFGINTLLIFYTLFSKRVKQTLIE